MQYTYNAWGELLAVTGTMANSLGVINPLRYRGYIYDNETGLYYLQSRYYNPEIGRFISADSHVSTGQGFIGYNMFAYCNNNPVILCDSEGESATVAGGIVGGVCGFFGALISEATDDNDGIRWNKVMQCTASGAIAGAAAGFVADVSIATFGAGTAILIAAGAGAVCSAANSAYTQKVLTGTISPGKVISDAIIGGITNGLCTGTSSVLKPLVKGAKEGIWHAVKAGVKYALTQVNFELTPGLLNVGSFVAVDLIPTVITGFGGLLWGIEYDYIVGGPL